MNQEYKIVQAPTPDLLETITQNLLDKNWQLQGGPFIATWASGHGFVGQLDTNNTSNSTTYVAFFQALTRKKANKQVNYFDHTPVAEESGQ